jgi:hypothetical protein
MMEEEEMPAEFPDLAPAKVVLLDIVSRKPIYPSTATTWDRLAGPLEENLKFFVSAGLLREATLEERLAQKYQISDLKRLLEQRRVAIPKGKKATLVDALIGALAPNDVAALVTDLRLYRPTEGGQKLVQVYFDGIRQERLAAEEESFGLLRSGNLDGAAARIAQFRAMLVDPYGSAIDWSLGMPKQCLAAAKSWLEYRYGDLPLSLAPLVAACMAFAPLWGDSHDDTAGRILRLTGGEFKCQSLDEYVEGKPEGHIARMLQTYEPHDRAFLYVHTKNFEASSTAEREQLLAERVGDGIEVVPGDEMCGLCNSAKRAFVWRDIVGLPNLPRHWGCLCYYQSIIR